MFKRSASYDKYGIFMLYVFFLFTVHVNDVTTAQVFRDSNITITYSSEFDRFPPESYIESVLKKTKEEGRS